jgi:hypothetical protein
MIVYDFFNYTQFVGELSTVGLKPLLNHSTDQIFFTFENWTLKIKVLRELKLIRKDSDRLELAQMRTGAVQKFSKDNFMLKGPISKYLSSLAQTAPQAFFKVFTFDLSFF